MVQKRKSEKLFLHAYIMGVGRVVQSVQRLATGWKVRGSNVGGDEVFRTCPDRPLGPHSLLYNGYRVFPGRKEWPGRDADPSRTSSAVVKKEQSYNSAPSMGCTACAEPQCLYKGALYLYLYHGCTNSRQINIFKIEHNFCSSWTRKLILVSFGPNNFVSFVHS